MKNNRHEEEMRYDKIKADIQRKVAEWKPEQPKLQLSHTVKPWYYGSKLCTTIIDHKPELKRRFH